MATPDELGYECPWGWNAERFIRQGLYGALAELAQRPEYIAPLREEAESTLDRWGATLSGCDRMVLLDSFLKECQRLHPPAAGLSLI